QEKEALKAIVQKFYDALSNAPTEESVADMANWMDENWNSTPTPAGGPGRDGFVKTLHMFHGMIPDLNWAVKEMLVDGSTVTVRSIATGTPNSPEGYFFGTPTDGSKKFEIMTIDTHHLVDGKFTTSFHVEDWLTAVQQVAPVPE
ncbi:MAG: ester cyclase, partial [Bacteroidota bacterium]